MPELALASGRDRVADLILHAVGDAVCSNCGHPVNIAEELAADR